MTNKKSVKPKAAAQIGKLTKAQAAKHARDVPHFANPDEVGEVGMVGDVGDLGANLAAVHAQRTD